MSHAPSTPSRYDNIFCNYSPPSSPGNGHWCNPTRLFRFHRLHKHMNVCASMCVSYVALCKQPPPCDQVTDQSHHQAFCSHTYHSSQSFIPDTHQCFPHFHNFVISRMLQKWNCMACNFLRLAFFMHKNSLEVLLSYCMYH